MDKFSTYHHLIELKYMAKEVINLIEDSLINEDSKVLILHHHIDIMHRFSEMMNYETWQKYKQKESIVHNSTE